MSCGNPVVSVIVPIYNAEKYLERCVDSIINQTYNNLEIILVDDGSKDKSGEICDRYAESDSRVRVIHKQNGGICSARNAGLRAAEGDFISFMDNDDRISERFVEYLLGLIDKHDADIAIGGKYFEYESGKLRSDNWFEGEMVSNGPEEAICGMFDMTYEYVWGRLIKKEIAKQVYFDENLLLGEDIYTGYLQLKLADKVTLGTEENYYYYQRNDSESHRISGLNKLDGYDETFGLVSEDVTEHFPDCLAYFEGMKFVYYAVISLRADDTCKATDSLWPYIKHSRKRVLSGDIVTPKKFGSMLKVVALLSYFGYGFTKFAYNAYLKITSAARN